MKTIRLLRGLVFVNYTCSIALARPVLVIRFAKLSWAASAQRPKTVAR